MRETSSNPTGSGRPCSETTKKIIAAHMAAKSQSKSQPEVNPSSAMKIEAFCPQVRVRRRCSINQIRDHLQEEPEREAAKRDERTHSTYVRNTGATGSTEAAQALAPKGSKEGCSCAACPVPTERRRSESAPYCSHRTWSHFATLATDSQPSSDRHAAFWQRKRRQPPTSSHRPESRMGRCGSEFRFRRGQSCLTWLQSQSSPVEADVAQAVLNLLPHAFTCPADIHSSESVNACLLSLHLPSSAPSRTNTGPHGLLYGGKQLLLRVADQRLRVWRRNQHAACGHDIPLCAPPRRPAPHHPPPVPQAHIADELAGILLPTATVPQHRVAPAVSPKQTSRSVPKRGHRHQHRHRLQFARTGAVAGAGASGDGGLMNSKPAGVCRQDQ